MAAVPPVCAQPDWLVQRWRSPGLQRSVPTWGLLGWNLRHRRHLLLHSDWLLFGW